jgi:tricorn protease
MGRFWIAVLLCGLVPTGDAISQIGTEPLLTEPSIAPNGSEVAFASGGDIWVAPLSWGQTRRLVSGPFEESRPVFSPDGTRLAFVSTRTGDGDIYVMQIASGTTARVTFTEGPEVVDGWSRDGKWLYYSMTGSDIGRMADVYAVRSEGGTPVPAVAERYVSEYYSAASPLGDRIAFTAYGENLDRWWRKGHSYLDASQIWIRDENLRYSRLNPASPAKELWPMWSPDGSRVYFVSDQSGTENLWVKGQSGIARQVTRFTAGRVIWPSISFDGKTIVFERDFGIWALDTATGHCAPVPIHVPAAPDPPKEHLDLSNQIEEFALSRDGQRLAFISRGEICPNPPDGSATRLTSTASRELQLGWSPDGVKLSYVSLRSGAYRIFIYDTAAKRETPMTGGMQAEVAPTWSPDGSLVAFIRDFQDVCVYDTRSHDTRVLARGSFRHLPVPGPRYSFQRLLAWSPDGSTLAYISSGPHGFSNAWIVPAAGGDAYQATSLATTNIGGVSWDPDGRSLAVDAALGSDVDGRQRLVIAKATNEAKRLFRAEILPVGVPVYYQHSFAAGGSRVVFLGRGPAGDEVFSYALDPSAQRLRQLSASPGLKRGLTVVSGRSEEIWFLQDGRIRVLNLETGKEQELTVKAEVDAEFADDKTAMFLESWRYIADDFYDSEFHGINWEGEKSLFGPLVERAKTPGELQRVLSLLVGDLNTSHVRIDIRARSGPSVAVGRLGVRFDPVAQQRSGVLRVAEVVSGGPADQAGVQIGDVLLKVDDKDLAGFVNLDEQLAGRGNKPVRLAIDSGGTRKTVVAIAIGLNQERDLLYEDWVRQRRAYVENASGGRLGYVHLYNMSPNTMSQLAVDLDSAAYSRKGLVIDIRNNYGGALDGHVLDVFSRKLFLKNVYREQEAMWQRHWYGQQAIQLPTVLVTNRHTVSDGECFVEGYRAEALGRVVGERTAGWVVSSGGGGLVDGSSITIPAGKTIALDGTDLERHPRPVDLEVIQAPGESLSGRESQLDAAIKLLLKQTGSPHRSSPREHR